MIVGFTGTREGMTLKQQAVLRHLLRAHARGGTLHHGDCIGADAQAHDIALAEGLSIVIHPPTNSRLRAYKHLPVESDAAVVEVFPERPYRERNQAIVEACEWLIAAPAARHARTSGTWMTIHLARRLGRDLSIILPSGEIAHG